MEGIPAEFWKNLGKEGTPELVDIYTVSCHAEFTKIVIIPLPKNMRNREPSA